MNRRMRLLDLYCGGGGAARGYDWAGFDVTGVDLYPQRNFPFKFIQADALDYLWNHGHEYDLIHASPVCKDYSVLRVAAGEHYKGHDRSIPEVRRYLQAVGKPYVIENVVGARRELIAPVMLCGSMFPGLRTYRHRLFETSPQILLAPPHEPHRDKTPPAGRGKSPKGFFSIVAGGIPGVTQLERFQAMGHDTICMTNEELNQSIPPQFTHWIGTQMLALLSQGSEVR